MIKLLKRKSELDKLKEQYKKLLKEAFQLQSINRSQSDQKYLEADIVLNKIKSLEKL